MSELYKKYDLVVEFHGKPLECFVMITIDEEDICDLDGSFDFGSKEENDAYLKKFQACELASYHICVKIQTKDGWGEGYDSLGGVHVRTSQAHADFDETIKEHAMIENASKELVEELGRMAIWFRKIWEGL